MNRKFSRRKAIAGMGTVAALSSIEAQTTPPAPKLAGEAPGRIAPVAELVNIPEFREMAGRILGPRTFNEISGGDRSFFDRTTFRPRRFHPSLDLDLTTELFGEKMFTPIVIGPMAKLQTYHPDGELALVRGAGAAKTVAVISADSSFPFEKIAAEAKTALWFQVYADADPAAAKTSAQQAVKAGAKALFITVGVPYRSAAGAPLPSKLAKMPQAPVNWSVIDQIRQGITVPVVIKGIMSPEEAASAVDKGVQGIVVSDHGGTMTPGMAAPVELLPSVVDAVHGRVPVLVDGGFQRGTDILKALILGATAVMVARPAVWALTPYGADGVRTAMEMFQNELARNFCMIGRSHIKDLDRSLIKIHEV
jgi:4-hydroxymandelate oxidase